MLFSSGPVLPVIILGVIVAAVVMYLYKDNKGGL